MGPASLRLLHRQSMHLGVAVFCSLSSEPRQFWRLTVKHITTRLGPREACRSAPVPRVVSPVSSPIRCAFERRFPTLFRWDLLLCGFRPESFQNLSEAPTPKSPRLVAGEKAAAGRVPAGADDLTGRGNVIYAFLRVTRDERERSFLASGSGWRTKEVRIGADGSSLTCKARSFRGVTRGCTFHSEN